MRIRRRFARSLIVTENVALARNQRRPRRAARVPLPSAEMVAVIASNAPYCHQHDDRPAQATFAGAGIDDANIVSLIAVALALAARHRRVRFHAQWRWLVKALFWAGYNPIGGAYQAM